MRSAENPNNASDLETEAHGGERAAQGQSTGHGGARVEPLPGWNLCCLPHEELCAGAELPVQVGGL